MTTSAIKGQILEDMKTAMRSQDKERLGTIRLILASLKQREVDTRLDLSDTDVLQLLDKMVKQRRDSISQFEAGNRPELAAKESAEIEIIQRYLPSPLSAAEIDVMILDAIKESQAKTIRDIAKVMALLKPKTQGRADMGAISQKVKASLPDNSG